MQEGYEIEEDEKTALDESKVRIYQFSEQEFLDSLRGRIKLVGLPDDAQIQRVAVCFEINGFKVKIHSESFEPVRPGLIPDYHSAEFELVEEVEKVEN